MSNKITEYLEKESGKKVTNADLLNSIREKAGNDYQNDIPKLNALSRINHETIPYSAYEIHQNEFFNILINRIGTVVFKALSFQNPLGVFKSDSFEYGETLQEIYVGLAEEKEFNAKDPDHPFKYADTPIDVFYHDINREALYKRTIEEAWTQKAFTSDTAFNEFIDKMFMSFLSSDTLGEYERVKNLIPKALTPVKVKDETISTPFTQIDFNEDNFIEKFNQELITRSNYFTVPSTKRFENGAGVPMTTPFDDQYLIVSASFSAGLDNMLARVYNMDKASVLAKRIIVDDFDVYEGEGKANGLKPFAALVSKNSIILKDKKLMMTNLWNPQNLSFNYWLHHHQIISRSLFENAHIYVYDPKKSDTPAPPKVTE